MAGDEASRGWGLEPSVVQAQGIFHTYPGGAQALKGVDLHASRGEFVVLLGPSGAGKSTLLRCLNGMVRPSRGDVEVEGKRLTTLTPRDLRQLRRRIGFVFQQFHLVDRLTVLENVFMGRLGYVRGPLPLLHHIAPAERAWATHCLDRVGLASLANQRADRLSGGERQRVAIARALAQRPTLLLADEPIASLDPYNGHLVMEILAGLHQTDGLTVICSLHQVEYARQYGKRVICLKDGRVARTCAAGSLSDGLVNELYGLTPLQPAGAFVPSGA